MARTSCSVAFRNLLALTTVLSVTVAPAGAMSAGTTLRQERTTKTLDEVMALMVRAGAEGRVGTARKTRPVDGRPAKRGEVVVTVIKGEGKETQSKPAQPGDWVVRNRCSETGDEQYLVAADKFADRYTAAATGKDRNAWQEFTPKGKTLRFLVLTSSEAPFEFIAPWGEPMVAKPGDAIVQTPNDERDVYRVAQASFKCTYEVVSAPPQTSKH